MRAVVVFALSVGVALGQDATRVFQLHHIQTEQDVQEFATMVRTIADLPQLTVDTAQKSMSLRGTAPQIAIAEFLFTDLDRESVPDAMTHEFRVPDGADDVVHVFFAPHTATIQQFQEIATTIRTITEIRRVFTYNAPRALAVRGTADQIAAATFLIHELDQPSDAKRADSYQYKMVDTANHGETQVRVFYLPYAATIQDFQEVATTIRTIGEVRRIFTYNSARALIVRGTTDQLAFTGWMVGELGKPVSAGTASTVYNYPASDRNGENLVRVFYVKNVPNVKAFQELATQIRTSTQIRRIFTYNASMALAMRGNEAQLAKAEQMLQDQQVASK